MCMILIPKRPNKPVITDKTDADGLTEAYNQCNTAIINNTLYI